ncbi:MAG TPA: MFS transporter [Sphingomonadaceae bacterium]|nr:MFS transporter [Sphingomonadaceae bacterium]
MSNDPRVIIDESPMGAFQIVAIGITILLNALDGFDVLAISFAAPGIAEEWGIDRAQLGIVLSMELIGMAVGSLFLGGVADRAGRRPTILGCLAVMATGMLLCTIAHNIIVLCILRFGTGLGIGGLLAATNAVTAEYANKKRRSLAVSLMAIGYPVGAVIGGSIAAVLLNYYNWRVVFLFGGVVSAVMIPIVLWRLPESIAFLVQKRPAHALERINATLARMRHPLASALPDVTVEEKTHHISDIFRPGLRHITIALTTAYFLHVATFYFILKWIPKIVVDMGFVASSAAGVLVWANVGGAIGGAVFGAFAGWIGLRRLTIVVLVMSTIMVTVFGHTGPSLSQLALISGIAGFFTNAGIVGLYALLAQSFPTHVRATGTGFAIGIGRGGSALSPIIAGFLFEGGLGLPVVATIMACGSILGVLALLTLSIRDRRAVTSP